MNQTCKHCSTEFLVSAEDAAFYERVSPTLAGKTFKVPPPTHCADCRQQRRLASINIRNLYSRTSSATGKPVVSIYSAAKQMPIYESKIWWGDTWSGLDYGGTIDTSRSILQQINELVLRVPHMSLVIQGNENADYVNYAGWDKNCYLSFCTDHSQDCIHTQDLYYCTNAVDCSNSQKLEQCYECVDCRDCYNAKHCTQCTNCSSSVRLFDCASCTNCALCVGLRQKQYCFLNKQLTAEQWQEKMKEYALNPSNYLDEYQQLLLATPRKEYIGNSNQDCSGNYLYNCKNTTDSFDCTDMEDSRYCYNMKGGGHHCYDMERWGHPAEFCYECCGVGEGAKNILFSCCCWNGISNLLYCHFCIGCSDCIACVGLKNKQYCIYNVQYTQEEYEKESVRIIQAMVDQGEWGEYFPIATSAFGYNESSANDDYVLTKTQAEANGWQWNDEKIELQDVTKTIPGEQLPINIADIPDDILNWAIVCPESKRSFKIVKQELDFYRNQDLSVPKLHPDVRHKNRLQLRNPRKLWNQSCSNCNKKVQTTYSTDRSETVYCEECYLKQVY